MRHLRARRHEAHACRMPQRCSERSSSAGERPYGAVVDRQPHARRGRAVRGAAADRISTAPTSSWRPRRAARPARSSSRAPASPLPQILVPDTLACAADAGARLARAVHGCRWSAVAGSNGKTTVKEMTAAILSRRGPCLATHGNLNNHIGVPLTLLRLDAGSSQRRDRDGRQPRRRRRGADAARAARRSG